MNPHEPGHGNDREDWLMGDVLAQLRAMRGDCPRGDELMAFFQDALPPEKRLSISEHLSVCGTCESFLVLLGNPAEDPEGHDWLEETTQRVARRMSLRPMATPTQKSKQFRWTRWVWQPTPAYVLLVLVLGTFFALSKHWGPAIRTEGDVSTALQGLHLNPARNDADGDSLRPAGRQFYISTQLPVQPGLPVSAAVVDGAENQVLRIEAKHGVDRMGNLVLVFPTDKFSPGRYRLIISLAATGAGSPPTFEMAFTLR